MSSHRFTGLERSTLVPRLRPTWPGIIVAAFALVFVMASAAVAAPKVPPDRDEVTVVTVTGGPFTTTGYGQEPFPLADDATFTQRAGEAVLLTATIDVTRNVPDDPCELTVLVTAGTTEEESKEVGLEMVDEWPPPGHIGLATASEGLPAPAVDTVRTLGAGTLVLEPTPDAPQGCIGGPGAFTVSIRLSIVTFRN